VMLPAVAGAIALSVWLVGSRAPASPQVDSLAVLPIRNLTGDPSQQHLADALSDALIGRLALVRGLNVAPPAMVASLQSQFEREIADTLGVRYLLAGSIVRAGNRLRVNVMINDPRAGRTVWAAEFDRTPETLIDARDEIVQWVASRLKLD
jgi:TolB-like protein